MSFIPITKHNKAYSVYLKSKNKGKAKISIHILLFGRMYKYAEKSESGKVFKLTVDVIKVRTSQSWPRTNIGSKRDVKAMLRDLLFQNFIFRYHNFFVFKFKCSDAQRRS